MDEMPEDYDLIFITNPTSLHYDMINKVVRKTKHMFIEKPVFDSCDYNVESIERKQNGIYYVACPLRHKSILKYVKEQIVSRKKQLWQEYGLPLTYQTGEKGWITQRYILPRRKWVEALQGI